MSEEKNPKILIIEDEALVARELKSRLTNMGCEVVGIAYGKEAIELARDTNPDLLLSDIHLKDGEDGIELAQKIRSERDVPVVFLTAYSDEDTVSRAKEVTPYGYIIKPVENRELQIAIDMAMYKFGIENELRQTQKLLQMALTGIGSAIVFVDQSGVISDLNDDAERILNTTRQDALNSSWMDVFSITGSSIQNKFQAALGGNDVVKLAPFIVNSALNNPKLVDGIVGPMKRGGVLILRQLTEISDPIETLTLPAELNEENGTEAVQSAESVMCQLLVAPKVEGDALVMDELLVLLKQLLRSTDLVSVYAGSQVSVSMPYTALAEGRQIADSVMRGLQTQFSQANQDFCIGLSYSIAGDQEPFELFRRASWALNVARDSGGGKVILWSDALENKPLAVSTDIEKQREYHNLVLLWNVLNVVAKASELKEVSQKVCGHLRLSFNFEKVAVLANRNAAFAPISGSINGRSNFNGMQDLDYSEIHFAKTRDLLQSDSDYVQVEKIYLFKLSTEKVLYVQAGVELSQSDLEFLMSLVAYFATGIARFDQPSTDIHQTVEQGALIYRAASMRRIYESIELVAPTDATVLITGESGTGKELLARTIHDVSDRRGKPFIIVDCGAVVSSLIESELFGHEKGAFTGADKRSTGRLKEADGGTILLDEIGELSLEVQVKLLRYVQNREIARVGSTRYETIDTRIIAATHRNLKALVDSGGFRQDLYYRLNVFTIDSPPLRDRVDDIMLIANHYLGIYSDGYNKNIFGFTSDAEQALLEYDWPGNIRELINVINRGVILCRDSRLSTIHLGLFPRGEIETQALNNDTQGQQENSVELWIKQLVDSCLADGFSQNKNDLVPLGQWLEEDLILKSLALNSEILNRAAQTLGIPESTLRRKVARMREIHGADTPPRPTDWGAVHFVMDEVISLSQQRRQTVFELVSMVLVKELESRQLSKKDAASLMGVSLPTYRRLTSAS
ncbi:MAG: sigma 54-interacting transcriptional regulator [Pseudomonadales bacterium]|nr:sigma 54-interacting transcriptional regulator [Pseudomonadales bacterium]